MKKFLAFLFALLLVGNLHAQTYSEWVEKSAAAVEKKDYLTAESALKEAMKKEPANPGNPMLLTNLGTVQRCLKKYDDALVSYNAVLAKFPDNIALLHSRANLYCEMEHWGEALLDYNRIIVLDDKNYQAYSRRALIHLQKKHFLEASADYAKLTELEPEKIDGKMGMALIEKRQQHWEQAESAYTDLVYRHRADAEIYVNRAECYINMKKLGRGLQDIEKALELGYSDPYIYMLRGQLRLRQFDKLSAKEDFEKAKSLGFDATVVDEYLKLINKK